MLLNGYVRDIWSQKIIKIRLKCIPKRLHSRYTGPILLKPKKSREKTVDITFRGFLLEQIGGFKKKQIIHQKFFNQPNFDLVLTYWL